jgi:hypothetical protein
MPRLSRPAAALTSITIEADLGEPGDEDRNHRQQEARYRRWARSVEQRKEKGMDWLAGNWIWILLIGGMFGMHLFGHGHGHGSGGRSGESENPERRTAGRS